MSDKYTNLKPTVERDVMNDFSFWFPKIRDCGIQVPKSLVFNVTPDLIRAFYMESPDDYMTVHNFVKTVVEPEIKANNLGLLFIKNGVFSNKFDAGNACLAQRSNVTNAIINVMQGALECCGFGFDGTGTLVVRQRIPHNARETPCIYNGLPFRPEYRVFYDFDEKRPVFVHDYWDKDYVYPHLYNKTDKIVYDAHYSHIKSQYDANAAAVMNMVAEAMQNVTGLEGPWSIDIMQDDRGGFWLIDMAVAELSAYWDKRPGFTPPPKPETPRHADMELIELMNEDAPTMVISEDAATTVTFEPGANRPN